MDIGHPYGRVLELGTRLGAQFVTVRAGGSRPTTPPSSSPGSPSWPRATTCAPCSPPPPARPWPRSSRPSPPSRAPAAASSWTSCRAGTTAAAVDETVVELGDLLGYVRVPAHALTHTPPPGCSRRSPRRSRSRSAARRPRAARRLDRARPARCARPGRAGRAGDRRPPGGRRPAAPPAAPARDPGLAAAPAARPRRRPAAHPRRRPLGDDARPPGRPPAPAARGAASTRCCARAGSSAGTAPVGPRRPRSGRGSSCGSTATCPTRCRCRSPCDVLHRDDDMLVVDKPHFLATIPRGRHVVETALVRLRRELDLPELSPAHRLDRVTAGRAAVRRAPRAARGVPDAVPRPAGAQDLRGGRAVRPGARAARGRCAAGSSRSAG